MTTEEGTDDEPVFGVPLGLPKFDPKGPRDGAPSPSPRQSSSTAQRKASNRVTLGFCAVCILIIVVLWAVTRSSDTTESETQTRAIPTNPTDYVGNIDAPFAVGAATAVDWGPFSGSDDAVWNITVGEMTDITDTVLALNEVNQPPPQGFVFAGFEVEATWVGLDGGTPSVELLQRPFFEFGVLGGSSKLLHEDGFDNRCGLVPGPFTTKEVYAGGTSRGVACAVIPSEDVDHPDTMMTVELGRGTFFFSPTGTALSPVTVPGAPDIWATSDPDGTSRPTAFPYETSVDVSTSAGTWSIAVAEPVETSVSESIGFRSLDDGYVFTEIELSITLTEAETDTSTVPSIKLGIAGGESRVVHRPWILSDCPRSVRPPRLASTVEQGELVEGSICVAVPEADLRHPNSRVVLTYGNLSAPTRIYFGG